MARHQASPGKQPGAGFHELFTAGNYTGHMQKERHIRHSGIEIGRLLGIPIVLDWSLFIAAALIITTLGLGPFSTLHADWPAATVWTVATLAAAGLFAAIYLHELGHSLVARHYGVEVERITLFILGGMAQMAEEPRSWRAEFWIAIAGPAVSVALGALLLTLALVALPAGQDWQSAESFLADLTPATALMLWLGNVNLMLAAFNCLPAFPLDGGRVLRALLWAATGSMRRATLWSAGAGRFFGHTLVALGVVMVLGVAVPYLGAGLQGLWLAFVGWFLTQAAAAGARAARHDAGRGNPGAEQLSPRSKP